MDSLNSVDRLDPSMPAQEADLLLPPRHPAPSVSGKKAHVLLGDDDQEVARAVKLRLRKSGYAVTVAYNGEAGLQAALESPPDAIILDMRMPLMDGLTMLTEMRREERMRGSRSSCSHRAAIGRGVLRTLTGNDLRAGALT